MAKSTMMSATASQYLAPHTSTLHFISSLLLRGGDEAVVGASSGGVEMVDGRREQGRGGESRGEPDRPHDWLRERAREATVEGEEGHAPPPRRSDAIRGNERR
jgi:hypothetical protein